MTEESIEEATNGCPSPKSNMTESKMDIEDLKKEGCMLWGKIRGYSYWPCIVTVDPMDGVTLKMTDQAKVGKNTSRCKVHVHFLGYNNMRAWVPDNNVMVYQGKEAYDTLASKCPKQKAKDFFPTKKYQRLFEKAVKVAEDTFRIQQEVRLKKLGLVYVLISDDEEAGDSKKIASGHNSNGHSTLPKITSGFFKTYQPVIAPPSKSEKNLDIFDFDDSNDQFNVDFRPKKENDENPNPMPKAPEPPISKAVQPTKNPPKKRKAPVQSPPNKAKKRKVQEESKPVKTIPTLKVTSADEAHSEITDLEDQTGEFNSQDYDDKGKPLLGSLIWGRMSGFPFWPCFITRSPDGDFKRTYGKRVEYHAQFFNWNNESGWVTGSMQWCPINDYHAKAKAACPKGPNTVEGRNWYPPARLAARWKSAVFEAQKTSAMSRQIRHNSLVVSYGAKKSPTPVKNSSKVATTATMKTVAKPFAMPNVQVKEQPVKKTNLERPCPASKKKVTFKGGVTLGKIELPKGWSYEVDTEKRSLKFHSPESLAYDGVDGAIAHLLQQNCCPTRGQQRRRSFSTSSSLGILQQMEPERFGWFLRCTDKMHFDTRPFSADQVGHLEGPVEYLKDGSLPPSWSVRTIRSKSMDDVEILYQASKDTDLRFKDKVSVAQFLEGMGHPALEIEQLLSNYPKIARVAPRDDRNKEDSETVCTIALSEWSVEEVSKNPVLAKTVTPCFVDMVKLPEIFLKHPHVRVSESNNEMTIRDSISDAFIAKKIIYD